MSEKIRVTISGENVSLFLYNEDNQGTYHIEITFEEALEIQNMKVTGRQSIQLPVTGVEANRSADGFYITYRGNNGKSIPVYTDFDELRRKINDAMPS